MYARNTLTVIRLAYAGSVDEQIMLPADTPLLVSFLQLRSFLAVRKKLGACTNWVMDSGAFSAHTRGTHIDLDEYIDTSRQLLASPAPPREIYGLDVMYDWRATLRNVEAANRAGVPMLPTFHWGTSFDVLKSLARDYPKVAIGGIAKMPYRQRVAFLKACFAHTWPKKLHAFGCGRESFLKAGPLHSTDATSWFNGLRYGYSIKYNGPRSHGGGQPGKVALSLAQSLAMIRVDVKYTQELSRRYAAFWAEQLKLLG